MDSQSTRGTLASFADRLDGIGLGCGIFALALTGLGVMGLVYADFALQWQPIPAGLPGRLGFAYLSGAVSLVAGSGLLVKHLRPRCAAALMIYLSLGWLLPQVLKAGQSPVSVAAWLGFFETLATTLGALILWMSLRAQHVQAANAAHDGRMNLARGLFGICCIFFGLSHFVYADFTAAMIPVWLPFRPALAYATGVGHVAAGLGILLGIRARLAAALEALMMSSFVVLLHVPSLWASPSPAWAPTGRIQWTALLWASTLAGSAWIVAGSLRDRAATAR